MYSGIGHADNELSRLYLLNCIAQCQHCDPSPPHSSPKYAPRNEYCCCVGRALEHALPSDMPPELRVLCHEYAGDPVNRAFLEQPLPIQAGTAQCVIRHSDRDPLSYDLYLQGNRRARPIQACRELIVQSLQTPLLDARREVCVPSTGVHRPSSGYMERLQWRRLCEQAVARFYAVEDLWLARASYNPETHAFHIHAATEGASEDERDQSGDWVAHYYSDRRCFNYVLRSRGNDLLVRYSSFLSGAAPTRWWHRVMRAIGCGSATPPLPVSLQCIRAYVRASPEGEGAASCAENASEAHLLSNEIRRSVRHARLTFAADHQAVHVQNMETAEALAPVPILLSSTPATLQLYENIRAVWSAGLERHILHFDGSRITRSSSRNFKLVQSHDDPAYRTIVQGGYSVDHSDFVLDVSWPMSPLHAFVIALGCLSPIRSDLDNGE